MQGQSYNLGYFNFKKVPKFDNFRVKFVNFRGEKVVFNVCYDHKFSAVFG